MDSFGEMLFIKGIDTAILYGDENREGILNYLSLYSDGKINLNTAGLPVLMSLSPKIDRAMAQAVLDQRREKPFRKTEELRSLPGWDSVYPLISSEITVQSNYFSVEVLGNYRDARAMVQAVIRREGKRTRVLSWKAG